MIKKLNILALLLGVFLTPVFAQDNLSGTQVPESLQTMQAEIEPDEQELSYDELRRFARAFALVRNQYVEPVSDQKLIDAAIAGMMQDLDPHSVYLDKEEMIDLQEETEGEFGGLGIDIGEENGFIKVISPIEGTPAAKAGILPGDLIVRINDESVKGKSMREAIKLLRGDPGSMVKLGISRASSDKEIDVDIKRELIKVRSVRSKMIEDTVYFRITQFQTNTVGDLVAQIKALKVLPKNIILDLRNNPGGLLNVSVGVVQIFADTTGPVVTTKARKQIIEEFSRYTPENILQSSLVLKDLPEWLHHVPMVVLVNVGSASASEIVAGALQDFKRATIMGNRSFGKGSVQVVLAIDDETGIKLTTARYYTPSGRSIQATGIVPDIVVSDTEKGDLFGFTREVDLADHLENEQSDSTTKSTSTPIKSPTAAVSADMIYELGSEQDFQLQQALNYLRGEEVNPGVISPQSSEPKSVEQEDNADHNVSMGVAAPVLAPALEGMPSGERKPVGSALDNALDKVLDSSK